MNSELKNDGLAFLFGRTVELGGLLLHWLAGGPTSLLRKGLNVIMSTASFMAFLATVGCLAPGGTERHWLETGDEIFLPLMSVVRVDDTFLVGVLSSLANGFQLQPSAVRSWNKSDNNNAKASQRSKVFTTGTPRKVSATLPATEWKISAAMLSLETWGGGVSQNCPGMSRAARRRARVALAPRRQCRSRLASTCQGRRLNCLNPPRAVA